jgi:hypothetical protein
MRVYALTMVKKSGRRIRETFERECDRDARATDLIQVHGIDTEFYYDDYEVK